MNATTRVDSLVIGANGFIGSAMVRTLLDNGAGVRAMTRPGSTLPFAEDQVEHVTGSLDDPESLVAAAQGVRIIYNCAGMSADWGAEAAFHAANVDGVRHLLDALERSGAERLVHLSTTDVYGYPKIVGDESLEIKDVGLPYNASKVAGEREIRCAVAERDLPVTVFRPASVYGPGAKEWVVEIGKLLLGKQMLLLDGGRSAAGLVYVDNLTRAMMIAAETPLARGQSYNIRDLTCETWRDYVLSLAKAFPAGTWSYLNIPASLALAVGFGMEKVWGALGMSSRPLLTRHAVYLLSRDQCFSVERARKELGFESWVSFEEGMERTREWIQSATGQAALA